MKIQTKINSIVKYLVNKITSKAYILPIGSCPGCSLVVGSSGEASSSCATGMAVCCTLDCILGCHMVSNHSSRMAVYIAIQMVVSMVVGMG
jgi:hypothetical protein